MAFSVDTQTINDLNIIGGRQGKNVYNIFNKTKTRGGAKVLKDMFLFPLSRQEDIAYRVSTIRYFRELDLEFPFQNAVFDTIEFYLDNTDHRNKLTGHKNGIQRKFNHLIGADTDFRQISKAVSGTLQFLMDMKVLWSKFDQGSSKIPFRKDMEAIKEILDIPELAFLHDLKKLPKLTYPKTAKYDELFRFSIRKELLKLLYHAYEMDTYIAVAQVSKSLDLAFAEIADEDSNVIEMQGVYHPLVPNAVANDLLITEESNMVFLTGANMAGKSTFMKAFSIAMYLAHVGFPVPVKKMRFTVQHGMFTTINLADNLNIGFSHFYAEVARVKKVAQSVNSNERLVVVFDELFRGTNVKDAHEATIAIVNAFASKRKCSFIISTHIIEAGEALRKMRENIKFLYLPTVMKDNTPQYTYSIEEGITSDRHGMLIIQNEKILDILKP